MLKEKNDTNINKTTVEPRQFAVPLSRFQSFTGLKNVQKLKISKNIKLKLEITFKDELQKTGFKA